VGHSPVYHSQLAEAARHAQRDGPLLIVGEAATGRRLLARAIHESGRRAGAPFVVVHCNAVPDDLLGDELFGQSGDEAAGIEARSGRLAATAGGTMVLFEPNAGSGLWERLEQAVQTCGLDVRIIVVALDGEAVQRTARFLSDAPLLAVPPLRERRGDIAELAHHLLRAASEQFNRGVEELSSAAQARLEAYDWPGNVRELQQAVERAVVLADDRVADVAQLPPEMRG